MISIYMMVNIEEYPAENEEDYYTILRLMDM
jgi:hypothetical protein